MLVLDAQILDVQRNDCRISNGESRVLHRSTKRDGEDAVFALA